MSDVQEAPHKVKKYDILRPHSGPEYKVVIESSPRRVRVVFNGETVADSSRMKMMHETRHLPVYYFPVDDVRMDLLDRTPSIRCRLWRHPGTGSGDRTRSALRNLG